MNLIGFSKLLIKKTLNIMGMDLIKLSNGPYYSFLGLKELPIRTIIDVGANEGQFAKNISRIFPDALIYCFEPLPKPFEELKKWTEMRGNRVKAFNLALGDKAGTVEMFNHLEHSPSSSLLKTTETCENIYSFTKRQTSISVSLTTLDRIVGNLPEPLTPDILVKLDVQGYEDRVIRGGRETISKARACILEVCLDRLYESQAKFKEILFLLDDLEYRYAGNLDQIYNEDGHVIYIDAVFVKQDLNIKK